MKKAFTLIELMISIILLSLIVSFLYQSVAQLQTSNQQFLERTNAIQKREDVLKLLYNDFINAVSIEWTNKENTKDEILMQSSNSLHAMSQPYLRYKVYRDENTLRRIESPLSTLDEVNDIFRFNDVVADVESFKVYEQKGHYLIYLKVKEMNEIYLDIIPPGLSKESPKLDDNTSNKIDDNTSSNAIAQENNTTVPEGLD